MTIETTDPAPAGRATDGSARQGRAPGNRVLLRGKVTSTPQERELPSGSTIVTLRLSVPREESTPMVRGSRQPVDWVDCSAWGARPRRSAARWCVGDIVEVEGALRRRFQRGGTAASTRLEVEILAGRIVTRERETRSSVPKPG